VKKNQDEEGRVLDGMVVYVNGLAKWLISDGLLSHLL
jgi:hypothetical protein